MNHEQIEGIAAVFDSVPRLTEIEIRDGERTLRLRRGGAVAAPILAPPPLEEPQSVAVEAPTSSTQRVRAEFVGVFHALGGAPVGNGDVVKKGQVLGHIETMRIPNDAVACVAGKIAAVLVQDNQPVEFGQPLFEITPAEESR